MRLASGSERWLDRAQPPPPKRHALLRRKKEPPPQKQIKRRLVSRLFKGVVLFSYGCTKLAVARLSGPILHQFCRLNIPAIAGLLTLQYKRGQESFLPFEVQAVLASFYAAVALGVTKIKRPGNDKYPDRFLEYMPGKLHLA